jgi:hypothetical protein
MQETNKKNRGKETLNEKFYKLTLCSIHKLQNSVSMTPCGAGADDAGEGDRKSGGARR